MWLQLDLAAKLKQDFGAKIHLYCISMQDVAYYRSQDTDDVFESITSVSILHDAAFEEIEDESEIYAKAGQIEQELGIHINDLILIKFYLSVDRDTQLFRFKERIVHPLKYWKFSKNIFSKSPNWYLCEIVSKWKKKKIFLKMIKNTGKNI